MQARPSHLPSGFRDDRLSLVYPSGACAERSGGTEGARRYNRLRPPAALGERSGPLIRVSWYSISLEENRRKRLEHVEQDGVGLERW